MPALVTPIVLVLLITVTGCSSPNTSSPPQKVVQQAEELPPASATPGRTDGLLFIPDGIDIKPADWSAG